MHVKKTIWTFGLISGAILSAMMLLTMPFQHRIGYDRALVIGYTTMVAAFLLIYFGVRSYRDNIGNGEIGFGRALAVGTLITVIASLCYTATWEVLYFSRPTLAAEIQEFQAAHVKESGKSQAEIDKKLADLQRFSEMYKNPAFNSALTFLEPLPVGLVMALISAGVLSRKRGAGGAVVALG